MSDQSIRIRPVERADYEQWLEQWNGYNIFYERIGPKAVAPEVTKTTWARFFDHYEPMHCLVAEQGDQIVGIVHYIYHRNTTMIGPACYLQDLFTKPNVRGKGIGRALIEGVYEQARVAGSPRVYWQTQETNTQAQILYDKIADRSGFIVYRKEM